MRKKQLDLFGNETSIDFFVKGCKISDLIEVKLETRRVKNPFTSIRKFKKVINVYVKNKLIIPEFHSKSIEDDWILSLLKFLYSEAKKLGWIFEIPYSELDDTSEEDDIDIEKHLKSLCNNLAKWYKNGYDIEKFANNVALIGILRELITTGDPLAKSALPKNIVHCIESGHPLKISFIILGGILVPVIPEEKNEYLDPVIPLISNLDSTFNEREILNKFGWLTKNPKIVDIIVKEINILPNNRMKVAFNILLDKLKIRVKSVEEKFRPKIKFPKELVLNWVGAFNIRQKINALPDQEILEFEKLTLQTNGFPRIPSWIKRFSNLEILDLSSNHIKRLRRLENLTKLKYLYIEDNHIKEIRGLGSLKNLRVLRFGESFHYNSGNEIQKIENLESLHKLEVLELANNKIQKIEGLNLLKNLERLDLSSNQIRAIEGLEELSNLKILHLSDNQIQYLDLSVIPALDELYLSENPIHTITGFGELKKIKSLIIDLDGCDLSTQEMFQKHFGSLGGDEYYSKVK